MSRKKNNRKDKAKSKNGKSLYFAFGSNMFNTRMRHRVQSAEVIYVGRLDNHCLTFHKRGIDSTGKCSVEESEGDAVWGVLYRIKNSEIASLDKAEGSGYDKIELYVQTPEGVKRAFIYKAKEDSMIEAMPTEWYRDIVLAGAKENGLPAEYIEQIAMIEACPDR